MIAFRNVQNFNGKENAESAQKAANKIGENLMQSCCLQGPEVGAISRRIVEAAKNCGCSVGDRVELKKRNGDKTLEAGLKGEIIMIAFGATKGGQGLGCFVKLDRVGDGPDNIVYRRLSDVNKI